MLHIFVRPSGVCAGHTVFCSIGTGVKEPEREAAHHRHSPKMKDKPAVTAVTVHYAVVVTDICVFIGCF